MARGLSWWLGGLILAVCSVLVAGPQAEAAVIIDEIHIFTAKEYWDGSVQTEPYWLCVELRGSGINTATFDPPAGGVSTCTLTFEAGYGAWVFETDEYADLTGGSDNLRDDYPVGDYVFSFNEGETDADSVTINHNRDGAQPGGIVQIVYPEDGDDEVVLNPVYEWSSASGIADVNALTGMVWHFIDPDDDELVYYELWTPPLNMTTWQPGLLVDGETYELEVGTWSAVVDDTATTDQGEGFTSYSSFGYLNVIEFTTPEPTTMAMLALGGLAIVFHRYRRK